MQGALNGIRRHIGAVTASVNDLPFKSNYVSVINVVSNKKKG